MSDGWKKLDLEGEGLQAINLRISRLQKRRLIAYALWLAFPTGSHRFYLNTSATGLVYIGLSVATVVLWFGFDQQNLAVVPLLAELIYAVYDLAWIDRRVNDINKALRMTLYIGAGAAPPPGYTGRYAQDSEEILDEYRKIKEQEKVGIQPTKTPGDRYGEGRRLPSFAEQEAMLRELAKKKEKK